MRVSFTAEVTGSVDASKYITKEDIKGQLGEQSLEYLHDRILDDLNAKFDLIREALHAEVAIAVSADSRPIVLAREAMRKVQEYAKNGLPKCYKNWAEYMCDFYPDLPWDKTIVDSLKFILADEFCQGVMDLVKKNYGVNFRNEIRRALKTHEG